MYRDYFRIAVMAILVNKNGEVLIGSSPRDCGFKFPQGGLLENEDALTGVKRELNEELGITISDADIEYLCQEKVRYYYPPQDTYFIYKGQELSVVKIRYNDSMNLVPQDDEFDELHWIQPNELARFEVKFRLEAYTRALELCELL